MNRDKSTVEAFFALLRAGLWEQSVRLFPFSSVDYQSLFQLAEEQAVVGLIAAGLEHVDDTKVDRQYVLPFMRRVLSLEARNVEMNSFIHDLIINLRAEGIHTILVKGQGIAQCYSRPNWRAAGDIDLFMDSTNYEKAKAHLSPKASFVDKEDKRKKHLGMTIDSWLVELHGLMPTELSSRINAGIEAVQSDIFEHNGIRVWDNGGVEVFLPNPDNDVILIFTHFLQHFFVGGIGLRQISDWCRLLWTFKDEIDLSLLERRLMKMGLMSEWKAFAFYAISYLGMPSEAMPFYPSSLSYSRKARRICHMILKTGNFGHNLDQSYRRKYSKTVEKSITFFRRFAEFIRLSLIFPWDGPRFFLSYVSKRTTAIL